MMEKGKKYILIAPAVIIFGLILILRTAVWGEYLQSELNKRINTLFTVKVKKNTKESSIFDVKTLIAAPKGIKLESQFVPIMID